MPLEFRPSEHRDWRCANHADGQVYACGWAEMDGRIVQAESLARGVLERTQRGEPVEAVWAGEYAVAMQVGGVVTLLADAIRSVPLLYRVVGEQVVATDEAALLSPQSEQLDARSEAEFLAAGFVTGPQTLYADIQAVQAGEVVVFHQGAATRTDVFRYHCSYDSANDEQALIVEHDRAVLTAFERMLASVGDRQIVLPLSGGLDSRLVASTLKRLGRENVLCFTYGMIGGKEDGPSQRVAEALGYERVLVPYDAAMLRSGLSSEEGQAFRLFAGGAVASPHLDDWLAVKQLKESGRIEPEAVFVPGHTGDFICGGHLKHLFDPAHHADPHDFDGAMLTKHYSLWRDHITRPAVRRMLTERLHASLGGLPLRSHEELAAAYELWEWRERQAKFIINSVRSYEWHGFEWRVPLWDMALMAFWKRVPLALKHEKYLYRAALQKTDETGVFHGVALSTPWDRDVAVAKAAKGAASPRKRLKKWFMERSVIAAARQRREDERRLAKEYDGHPVGLARLWEREAYVGRDRDKRHSQALLTREYLASLGSKGL